MVSVETLLKQLPAFRNEVVTIKQDQNVSDIIKQIIVAHKKYRYLYDKIALYFDADTIPGICSNIYDFLKTQLRYKEEPETKQTTAVPQAILSTRTGDCKHYSLFAGGILDALNRLTDKKISWCYRFVSYNFFSKQPHHVFVVVFYKGDEIWIDAIPGADKHTPVWQLDKFVNSNTMPLYDVIGNVPGTHYASIEEFTNSAEFENAVQVLVKYNLVNLQTGDLNNDLLQGLLNSLQGDEKIELVNALNLMTSAAQTIGYTVGEKIVHAAAKFNPLLALGRGAFLLMLRWNVKAWAKNIDYAVATKGLAASDPIGKRWYLLGGDAAPFWECVREGRDKKMIGATTPENVIGLTGAEIIAAITAAAPIILALVPIIKSVMGAPSWEQGQYLPGITVPGSGTTLPPGSTPTGGGVMEFIQSNPIPVALAAGAALWYFTKKKKVSGANENLVPILLLGGAAFWYLRKKPVEVIHADQLNQEQATNIYSPLPIGEPIEQPVEVVTVKEGIEPVMDYNVPADGGTYYGGGGGSDVYMMKEYQDTTLLTSTQQFV